MDERGFRWHFSPSVGSPTVQQKQAWVGRNARPLRPGKPGPIARAVMAAKRREMGMEPLPVEPDEDEPQWGELMRLVLEEDAEIGVVV